MCSTDSRSNEKERSELKGGFRGIVNISGAHHYYIKSKAPTLR